MASSGADPWGNGNPLDNPRYYDSLMHRPCGPELSQADKLLAAHARGVEQGAAAEREAIRSEMVEEADECERQNFTAAAVALREFSGRFERDQHQQASLPLAEARA